MSKQKNLIQTISELVNKNQLSSTELRYVFQQVRKKCNLVIPKRAKRLPDFLNAAEVHYLLNNEKDTFTSLLMEFLIFTGLRISEASNLMVQDIDFSNDQLKVVQGKGNKDRYVPLSTNINHKIRLYLKGRTRGYLFQQSNGKKYVVRALQKRVTKSLNSCKFNKVLSTHSLRHTFACLCLVKGISLDRIKLFMGHSSIKTTEIYAKLELGPVKDEFLSLMDYRR